MKNLTQACLIAGILFFIACKDDKPNGPTLDPQDYRYDYVGTYTGFRDCEAYQYPSTRPDMTTTIEVAPGNTDSTLIIDGVEVVIDSSGRFPDFSTGVYQLYEIAFRNDSLFRLERWGSTFSYEECLFEGVKQ